MRADLSGDACARLLSENRGQSARRSDEDGTEDGRRRVYRRIGEGKCGGNCEHCSTEILERNPCTRARGRARIIIDS